MNPAPTPITVRLRKAQHEPGATLYLLHRTARVELYARHRPGRPVDYAVVRGRLTGHGGTPARAIAAVRQQVQAALAAKHQPLSWRDGLEAGFSSQCLHHFCQTFQLAPTATLTRAQLITLLHDTPLPARAGYYRAVRRLGIHLHPHP